MEQELSTLRDNLEEEQKKRKEAEKERDRYKNLLYKPLHEIAEKNAGFSKTYEDQMELMADWMVSQKAFKELAIQFGFDKGLSAQETIQMGIDKKIDVLNDKHDPAHNTIVGDSTIIGPRRDKLKEKIQAAKST